MMRSIDESLRRLGTDHVDVYWLHARDGVTPWEEIMRGLDDLVSSGKVLYVAVSGHSRLGDLASEHACRASRLVALRRHPGRIQLGGADAGARSSADGTWSRPRHHWVRSPLAGGALTGKYTTTATTSEPTRLRAESISERTLRVARVVAGGGP